MCIKRVLAFFLHFFTLMDSWITWVVVYVGQQLQLRPEACEVGGVSGPLQDDCQLLNAFSERFRRLQLQQKMEEQSQSLKT